MSSPLSSLMTFQNAPNNPGNCITGISQDVPLLPLGLQCYLFLPWQLTNCYSPLQALLRLMFIRKPSPILFPTPCLLSFPATSTHKVRPSQRTDAVAWVTMSTSQWLDHQLESPWGFWQRIPVGTSSFLKDSPILSHASPLSALYLRFFFLCSCWNVDLGPLPRNQVLGFLLLFYIYVPRYFILFQLSSSVTQGISLLSFGRECPTAFWTHGMGSSNPQKGSDASTPSHTNSTPAPLENGLCLCLLLGAVHTPSRETHQPGVPTQHVQLEASCSSPQELSWKQNPTSPFYPRGVWSNGLLKSPDLIVSHEPHLTKTSRRTHRLPPPPGLLPHQSIWPQALTRSCPVRDRWGWMVCSPFQWFTTTIC